MSHRTFVSVYPRNEGNAIKPQTTTMTTPLIVCLHQGNFTASTPQLLLAPSKVLHSDFDKRRRKLYTKTYPLGVIPSAPLHLNQDVQLHCLALTLRFSFHHNYPEHAVRFQGPPVGFQRVKRAAS